MKKLMTVILLLLCNQLSSQEWKVITLTQNQTLSDTTLVLNLVGGSVIDTLSGGFALFDTSGVNKITPINYGDTYQLRFDFTVKQLGNNGVIKATIDIGPDGSPIEIVSAKAFPSNQFEPISLPLPVYSLGTFVSNGGKVNVTLEGSFEFESMGIYLLRTSNAEDVENGKTVIVNTPSTAQNLNQALETIITLGSIVDGRGLGISTIGDTIVFPEGKGGVYSVSLFPELIKSPNTGSLNIVTEFTLYHKNASGTDVIAVQSKDLLNDSNNFLTFSRIVFVDSTNDKLWITCKGLGLFSRDVEFATINSKLFQIAKLY